MKFLFLGALFVIGVVCPDPSGLPFHDPAKDPTNLLVISGDTPDRSLADIVGGGSSFVSGLLEQWMYSYTILQPDISLIYTGGGSTRGRASVFAGVLDFGFSETSPIGEEVGALDTYPYAAATIIVMFNNPRITAYFAHEDTVRDLSVLNGSNYVIFGRETIAAIYSGDITQWNDPAIIADNTPGLADVRWGDNNESLFTDQTILKIVRSGSSGVNSVFTEGMSQFSADFSQRLGVFSRWPAEILARPDYLGTVSSDSASWQVRDNYWSIGYSSLGSNYVPRNEFALIPNFEEELTSPLPSVNPALARFFSVVEYDDNFLAVGDLDGFVDIDIPGIYPLIGITYLVINPDAQTDCGGRTIAFRFLRYTLLENSPVRPLGLSTLYLLPDPDISREVLAGISATKCGGTTLLVADITDNHDSAFFPAFLAFNMVSLVILIGSGIYFVMTIPGVRKTSMIRFTVCLLFGGFLCLFATIFFYLVPDETWVCQCRLWLTAVGLTLMVVALAARNWNLLQIFLRRKDFFAYETSERDINVLMAIVFILQLALLISWCGADLYEAGLRVENDLNREFTWQCESSNETLWFALEIALFAILILFMIVTVYFVWKFSADIVGHKYTVMSIYNLIMLFTIMIVLFATTIEDDEGIAIAAMTCLLVVTWSTIFLNFHITLLTMGSISGSSSKSSKNR